ncbi:MAG: hypothetical protein N2442_13355 [Spirochaetes bacterium]|nr:hypothetical protein [Spirochaetota bacterium]
MGIPLPPSSPPDYPSYEGWKAFARSEGLPVAFELDLERAFFHWIKEALCMITTSLREGFGFTFLEPWTAGKRLIGRRISTVVENFKRQGIEFPNQYEHLYIPTDCIPIDQTNVW